MDLLSKNVLDTTLKLYFELLQTIISWVGYILIATEKDIFEFTWENRQRQHELPIKNVEILETANKSLT